MLVLQEIRKSYGKTQALISLDLRLRPGAVHGLVGENGARQFNPGRDPQRRNSAGRGLHRIERDVVELTSPDIARDRGISKAFQELTLIAV